VERSPAARRALRANLGSLGCAKERARVVARDAQRALEADVEAGRTYTLVLVDAPYAGYAGFEAESAQHVGAVLAAGGVVVVETARGQAVRLPLRETGVKLHGDTRVTFLAR
jgi:16S rRNA G966 N2-methylase RsmD